MGRKPAQWWGRVSLHFAARRHGLGRQRCIRGLAAAWRYSLSIGPLLEIGGCPIEALFRQARDKVGGRRQPAISVTASGLVAPLKCPAAGGPLAEYGRGLGPIRPPTG